MVGLHILEETLKNLLYLGTLDWLIHCLLEKNEVNLTPQQMGNIRPLKTFVPYPEPGFIGEEWVVFPGHYSKYHPIY